MTKKYCRWYPANSIQERYAGPNKQKNSKILKERFIGVEEDPFPFPRENFNVILVDILDLPHTKTSHNLDNGKIKEWLVSFLFLRIATSQLQA